MVVGEIKTCLAVVALLTCGGRSMRAREAVSVRGGRAAVLRGSAPHERTRRFCLHLAPRLPWLWTHFCFRGLWEDEMFARQGRENGNAT